MMSIGFVLIDALLAENSCKILKNAEIESNQVIEAGSKLSAQYYVSALYSKSPAGSHSAYR